MREHNKGTDHMLLPCGYAHILQPENSLLEMLAQEGFIVERVNESNLHMMNNESSYLKKINC